MEYILFILTFVKWGTGTLELGVPHSSNQFVVFPNNIIN